MNISKGFLIHSAEIFEIEKLDSDRKPIYKDSVLLSNIWIDSTDSQSEGSNGKQPSGNATLFFDCLNSEPKDFLFKKNMKVIFEEKEYFVQSIKSCYGLNGLEHYEVGLV